MDAIPILKLESFLLVSVQIDLEDRSALQLQEDLSRRIVDTEATGVLIDISALEIVDSFIGRMLSTTAAISRVLDAQTVVVGMRPAVAITMVELGLNLDGIHTALDVERGLALLRNLSRTPAGSDLPEFDEAALGRGLTVAFPAGEVQELAIGADQDVVRVRQATRVLAVTAKLSLVDQTKLVTAASELARNTLIYGGGGAAHLELVVDGAPQRCPGLLRRRRSRYRRRRSGADRRVDHRLGPGAGSVRCPAVGRRLRPGHRARQGNTRGDRQVGPVTTPPGVVHVEDLAWMCVEHASAVGTARRAVAAFAARLGIAGERGSEIELVVSEIADNQLKHAGSGWLLVRAFRSDRDPGLCLVGIDSGPGMADFGIASRDGHSTAGTLGIGLGAVLRLSDSWDVYTEKGAGTVLVVGFGYCDQIPPGDRTADAAGLTRAMSGQDTCGDAYALRRDGEVVTGLIADGLGHGPLAATASRAAVRSFLDAAPGSPGVLMAQVHRDLQGTRGAAVAIAQMRTGAQLCYSGIGNIGGHLFSGRRTARVDLDARDRGRQRAAPWREFDYALDPDTVVVLHSDGVSEKILLPAGDGLRRRTPMVIAATVLRDHGVRNDDAGVLVMRPEGAR